jgi:BirA family biotin operon repressor/biotin-[acetyl-CoA-carboxylase] ligase
MAVALSGPSRDTIPMLPLAAGLALFDAVHASSGLTPELKWPNDLLLSGKKAAGILTEAFSLLPDRARAMVGVGVNLTQTEFPEALRDIATSVSREGGALSTVEEMAARFVIELENRLAIIEAGDKKPIVDEWRQKAEPFGRRVRIGDLEGITRDLAPDGRLILKTDRGEEVLVAGGIVEPVD